MDSTEELVQRVANNDPNTTEVVLKGMAMQPESLTALAMALISNTHVKTLYLASLKIYSQQAQILASALVQNTYLETVWLEDNQITSSEASSFATVLYVNRTITTFGLRNNLIGNEGALHILSAMQTNTKIQSIILDGNSIEYQLLAQIKALAAKNMHDASSAKHEVSLQTNTKAVFKYEECPPAKAAPAVQKELSSTCCKSKSDCDHDHSIASWNTLETIMEESESEDEDGTY
jgi:Ran GTPase-activating protein (RanGAP) involved in mRNA processing and transport